MKYQHDCSNCIPLGQTETHDLYYCDQGGAGGTPTVVARYGDDGPEYTSGICFADVDENIGEAVRLAEKKGLMTRPVTFDWNYEDLYALTHCIEERWRPLATTEDSELVPCELCVIAIDRRARLPTDEYLQASSCMACVIFKDTGCTGCVNTPYDEWMECSSLENAQAELDYLEDLRDRMLASLDYSNICGHDRKQKAYMEKHFRYFDNEGQTFDQYTIINTDPDLLARNRHPSYGASEHPFHPQGFGQYSEVNREIVVSYLGKEVDLEDLPEDVQKLALQLIPEETLGEEKTT